MNKYIFQNFLEMRLTLIGERPQYARKIYIMTVIYNTFYIQWEMTIYKIM